MEIEKKNTEGKCKYLIWNKYGSSLIGSATLVDSTDPIIIEEVRINRNRRGKGIGSTLLEKILDDFGSSEIMAKTFKPRLDWYERHGFEKEEKRGQIVTVKRNPQ